MGRNESKKVKIDKEEHASIGIDVTTQRLIALKASPDIPAGIEIIDLNDTDGNSTGTLVKVFVPK